MSPRADIARMDSWAAAVRKVTSATGSPPATKAPARALASAASSSTTTGTRRAALRTDVTSMGSPFHWAEVTCRVTRETPAEQGFHCFRGWVFWLLQGEWDRRVEEFEGSVLGGGGFGEGGHGGAVVVVAVAQVDPGQASQVVQQCGEAAGGLVVGGGLGRGLGISCVGALGGGDGVERVGPVLVGERQRSPCLA